MAERGADIAIETGYLREFASQDFGPQLGGIAGAATTAYSAVRDPQTGMSQQLGPSVQSQAGLMEEGQALFRAEGVARSQLVNYITDVSQGMTGYRAGVTDIATAYDETEGRVLATMNGVLPQDANLPEQDPRFSEAVLNEE